MICIGQSTGRRLLLFCLILIVKSTVLFASDDLGVSKDVSSLKMNVGFMIHNFSNPGSNIGIEIVLAKTGKQEILIPINVAFYIHPKNSRVYYLNSGIGFRWHSIGRIFLFGSLCIGYIHQFVDGEIYFLDEDEIVRVTDYGQPGFMPYVDFGIAVDAFEGNAVKISPFFEVLAFGQYPYNGYMLPHFGLQLGTYISIKSGEKNQ